MQKRLAGIHIVVYGAYTDGVKISAAFAKAVAHALFHVLPHDADAQERAAVQVLLERAGVIDRILNARADVGTIKTQFVAFGNCWGGMYDALLAKRRLPASVTGAGKRASAIIDRLFNDGIMFIRLESPAAWAEGDRRYRRIVELGLEREIGEVIGADYVEAARRATVELGEAIGTAKKPREVPSRTGLADAMFLFSRGISRYCRLLAAKVDETDAASVERFRKAVAPIDEHRSTRTPREADEPGDPVVPDAPSEPVTPTPATDDPTPS